MNKSDFLDNPLGQDSEAIPPDWVREGWASPRFQDDVVYVIARSLSKTGGFGLVSDVLLLSLSGALTTSEAVDLYARLRDESGRLEYQWRDDFTAIFRQAADGLPSSNDAELVLGDLEYIVTSGDGRNLQAVLSVAHRIPAVVEQLAAFASKARAKGSTLIADLIAERLDHPKGGAA